MLLLALCSAMVVALGVGFFIGVAWAEDRRAGVDDALDRLRAIRPVSRAPRAHCWLIDEHAGHQPFDWEHNS